MYYYWQHWRIVKRIVFLHETILTLNISLSRKEGRNTMAKNRAGTPSWKQNHPSTLLSNSVERSERAVKQAMSHPEETAVEHAFHSIERTENALHNAEQRQEHLDIVGQNKDKLTDLKQQLHEVDETLRDLN